jgi:hypothetical protein
MKPARLALPVPCPRRDVGESYESARGGREERKVFGGSNTQRESGASCQKKTERVGRPSRRRQGRRPFLSRCTIHVSDGGNLRTKETDRGKSPRAKKTPREKPLSARAQVGVKLHATCFFPRVLKDQQSISESFLNLYLILVI